MKTTSLFLIIFTFVFQSWVVGQNPKFRAWVWLNEEAIQQNEPAKNKIKGFLHEMIDSSILISSSPDSISPGVIQEIDIADIEKIALRKKRKKWAEVLSSERSVDF